jgi:PEP-CTERM motif
MKSTFFTSSAMLSLVASTASAAIIVSDPFLTGGSDYSTAAATISGQGPTVTGMTGNWLAGSPGNFPVVTTGLDYTGANYIVEAGGSLSKPAPSSARLGRLLSTPYTNASTETVYLSFLMQTPTTFTGDYRALELHNGGFVDGTHREFQLGVHSGDFNSTTNYGVRLNNSNTTRAVLGTNNAGVNLFVAKFVFSTTTNADSVTVWQNPDLNGSGDLTGGTTLTGFDMAFDRISVAAFSGPATSWDEIRIGTSVDDIRLLVVPEPSAALLGGLGLLALLRRRR